MDLKVGVVLIRHHTCKARMYHKDPAIIHRTDMMMVGVKPAMTTAGADLLPEVTRDPCRKTNRDHEAALVVASIGVRADTGVIDLTQWTTMTSITARSIGAARDLLTIMMRMK